MNFTKTLKLVFDKINDRYNLKTQEGEDRLIADFISQELKNNSKNWLEVGSGKGRFIRKINNLYPKTNIVGIDINPSLASLPQKRGIKMVCGDILEKKIKKKFDIVHASHIIEHFQYKEAMKLLDKCLSLLKTKGSLIIRSPLFHPKFYDDISHIKPYPPEAVLNYFFLEQQAKISKYKIIQTHLYYRFQSFEINSPRLFATAINTFFKIVYMLGVKSFKPNGYILIIKKIS